ncbi:Hypothetical predicted protein [Olea europaea subsp. europaea]|uniref:Uncharacterized protein n=1 Tax=Olea europaea subsp. europaea TaxID=158383 RepID=A0A8S0R7Z7_OLEEU|nr:Hypothetical predicted protein [Olea europaea subsp. europaea]
MATWVPDTDCCHWYAVDCEPETNRINDLHLVSANLSGQIPEEIADLPYLETLIFHKITNLNGNIPISIPTQKLIVSRLILQQFFRFDPFITLPTLKPQWSSFRGAIPRGWGDLNFTLIKLQRNKLEGDISSLLGKNKTIIYLDLNRNMLQSDISEVEFPYSLTFFEVNHNRIIGSLPEGLTQLGLDGLNVSYDGLCGPIPKGGRLQDLEYTSYFHNRCLCGAPLPDDCKRFPLLGGRIFDPIFFFN